jgi:hypothetical protein
MAQERRTPTRTLAILAGLRTGSAPGPASTSAVPEAGASVPVSSCGANFSDVMNSDKSPAAVRQSRALRPHHRRNSATELAYALVVSSA